MWLKFTRCDRGSFSGGLLPFLPVCCRDRAERISAVRTIRDYGKSLTVCPRIHRDKPQKWCLPLVSFFSAKAYRCLCIFCQQRLLCSGVSEKIFLSGILLHVAVPFLLILRLLCLSSPYPGTAERTGASYVWCLLSGCRS